MVGSRLIHQPRKETKSGSSWPGLSHDGAIVGGRASDLQSCFSGFETQSSLVPLFVLCLSHCFELITCTALAAMIVKMKHSLTVWMPYIPLRREWEALGSCDYAFDFFELFCCGTWMNNLRVFIFYGYSTKLKLPVAACNYNVRRSRVLRYFHQIGAYFFARYLFFGAKCRKCHFRLILEKGYVCAHH